LAAVRLRRRAVAAPLDRVWPAHAPPLTRPATLRRRAPPPRCMAPAPTPRRARQWSASCGAGRTRRGCAGRRQSAPPWATWQVRAQHALGRRLCILQAAHLCVLPSARPTLTSQAQLHASRAPLPAPHRCRSPLAPR
jgi:hypothetical protein